MSSTTDFLPVVRTAVGIHASADGGRGVGWVEPVQSEIATLQPEVIKFQSNHDPQMVSSVVAHNKQYLQTVIVRAFLSWGRNDHSPSQFVEATLSDSERTVHQIKAQGIPNKNIIVELHNEPNLIMEGWNFSWGNGTECVAFFADVLDRYKARMPDVQYGVGALSPGGGSNIRRDSREFLQEMTRHPHWQAFDVHLVHLYTVNQWQDEIWWVDHCQSKMPTMPVWITESSFHTADNTAGTVYAAKLVELLDLLDQRPTQGVTFYCVSASNPDFYHEAWCRSRDKGDFFRNVVSRGIAEEIRWLRPLS